MPPDPPSDPPRELTDDDAERAAYDALRRDGRFVPQSPEEVAAAEAEIDEPAVQLPPALRDPLALLAVVETAPAPQPPTEPVLAEPSSVRTTPTDILKENRMRPPRFRKVILRSLVLAVIAAVPGYQVFAWRAWSHDARVAGRALQAKRDELARVRAEQEALRMASRKGVAAAEAEELKVVALYRDAHESARKAIEDKDFVVRLTGPEHIQPGAPNTWQIETLRNGVVGRPKGLDVIVKDARDKELFRQTHDKPVGVTTLELPASFWTRVDPGSELFLEVVAHTDDRDSVLAERLPLARPVFVTHLVTDKPLYKPGETVRFRSLTLDRSTLQPPDRELHLVFKLRDPGDAVTPLDEGNGRLLRDLKPVLGPDGKPLRGIGVGEYAIPADAPGGEYKLDLSEVIGSNGKQVPLETRKFIVNRYVPDTFEKKLEFDGKSYGPDEVVQARIEVSRTAGGPMKDARANVVAAADGKTFHEQKDARFTALTDAGGMKTVLDVRFKLPASVFEKKDGVPDATLSVNIQDGSDTEAIVRPIPLVTKKLSVEFFPEGGDMVAGVPGRVYFMVRSPVVPRDLSPAKPGFTAAPSGKPADLKGIITDGTNTVAEVATLTDADNPGVNRGHGVFTLTPERGKTYFLKLTSPTGITEPTPSGFRLPAANADGVALTARDAVTRRGDAIRVRLESPTGPKTLHVGAYVRERLVARQKVVLEANAPADVELKGDESAGGVTRITVFEELTADDPNQTKLVPRAERLVFRNSGTHLALKATPDKSRYAPSDKVRLDLSATTEADKPTPAVLLVGVVNRSVITMADNKTDRLMPTHFLLSGEVKNSAELEHADFLLTDRKNADVALDLLLGTQGWRRFAEQELPPAKEADKTDVETMLVAHGQRPSAPLELLKLEEQRLSAEYAPKMELARLRTAAVEAEWNALPMPLAQLVQEAQAAMGEAAAKQSDAKWEVQRFEERFEVIWEKSRPVLFVCLCLLTLFVFFYLTLTTTADKPAERGQPATTERPTPGAGGIRALTAAVFAAVVGVLAIAAITTLGSNANSTFSFVGSSIKPPGGGGGGWGGVSAPPEPGPVPRQESQRARDGMEAERARAEAARASAEAKMATVTDNSGVMPKSAASKPGIPKGWDRATPGQAKAGDQTPSGELHSDRARVIAAFRSRRSEADGTRGKPEVASEFDPAAPPNRTPAPAELELPPVSAQALVPPFIVREYAHQRDPSLGGVRSDFTETVYWHPVLVLPETGKATVEFQLSDDIARYQVLVAGHTLDGRIGAVTTTVEARKPFSVDPKLPLEIAHTDTVDVPVRVTNDSDTPRTVSLTATTTGFKTGGKLQESIALGPNAKGRAMLRLSADKLEGSAGVLIAGASGADADSIARTIRIVPDGFPGVGSVSDMLDKGRGRGTVTLPKDVVPGSLRVRLEVYPTSLADLVKGLDGLLQEPNGCFEQTSTTNYPNTLILDYMNQTNQANPQVAARAKGLLDKGYGRLTGFECPDTPLHIRQGFEWFGAADQQHEALTAYGLLQFKDMARVSAVDPQLIKRTQEFLMSRRDGQGGFKRNPRGHHHFGDAPDYTNNAYIVWALVESDPDDAEKLDLKAEIAALKAEALNGKSPGGKDAYFVALTANVMLLRNDREAASRLLDRLKDKHTKGGAVTGAVTSITHSGGRDLEIETTALALLGWLRANDPTAYTATVKDATKWLSQQRGGSGGFGSTQSTILALKALALYAKTYAHPPEAGTLRLLVGGKAVAARAFTERDVEVIGVDVPNAEAAFKPGDRNDVEVVTGARHPYPFALAYTYTTLTPRSAPQCAVKLGTKLGRAGANEGDTVPLHVTLENTLNKGHGMAVAIIGIPAGMKVPTDVKQLTDLREKGAIAYFETRGRELMLYWRELAPEQKIALTVDLVCDVPGTYRGPASRGYLYYDADHKHWVEPLAITIAPMAGKD